MKGRKKGCSLPLMFILLFICITGHATTDLEDGEEEDVLGAAFPPLKLGHSVCAMKADEGPCKAIHMRYYFNIQSRECEIFEYGGCHGNENNFLTLEECEKTCVVTGLPRKMMLANIKKANLLPIVPAEEHPNTVNSSSPAEEPHQPPGISRNLLPTAPDEKSNTLNSSSPKEERNQFPIFFEPPPIPSLCMTPMDRGLCRAKELRFFYNYSTGRCHPFTYSGCGGNENNFTSRKSCLRICKKGFNKKKGERRLIKIKKKRKKQPVKALGDEIMPERIQL
ncbi:tissue factor pathway inhibitor (lipoprotein-associated coagulation inhibitor), transcript variant X2 [Columba livia]|uniref:Tissue factor pathway inhibitor n=1 Tax=Columba livia TaxID=8932 RepID=A0A2I0MIG4_COLLI|nr:tissue factor pathway inhibitor (lipoprotein-associated coagulation inhibitor), transcript variant X2 [Columba livia]